jgi:20S proteasome subunit beta 7
VIAVAFDGGVAVLADRIVSYGKMAKFRQTSRIYRINSCTLISFGGDHADFQLIQNMLQRRSYEFKAECGDVDAEMPPVAIYSYLNALLYNRYVCFRSYFSIIKLRF